MKKKNYRILLFIPLLLSVLVLAGCKVMMPSDYKKLSESSSKIVIKWVFMVKLLSLTYIGLH